VNHDALAAAPVVVVLHNPQRQILGIDNQRGADQVAVDGVAAGTAPGLDFEQNTKLMVNAINVVADAGSALLAEQDWQGDSIRDSFSALDLESDAFETLPQQGQDLVAGQSGDLRGLDFRPRHAYDRD
jgi:hypothetical protein